MLTSYFLQNTLQINPKKEQLPESLEEKYPPIFAQCLIPCDVSIKPLILFILIKFSQKMQTK